MAYNPKRAEQKLASLFSMVFWGSMFVVLLSWLF